MSIWFTLVTVLLLILPALSQVISTTCEITSVEAGDDAILTIHFGEDFNYKHDRDFSVTHLDRNNKETRMLSCVFSNGDVECQKTPCCTWESKVTDVFRVYIHNASQQLEGKFWGFVIPADTKYQKYCSFTLKASTCPTKAIHPANSHMTCSNQSVTIGQSCRVTCNSGHYFQENQTSVTYTCVGRNKWSPEIPITSCEAYTCPKDVITAENSHVFCSNNIVTVGHTCTMTCNSGHYFQENQTFVTYTCVWKNKWSPEIPVRSCEEQPKAYEMMYLYFLFLLLVVILVISAVIVLKKRRQRRKEKKCIQGNTAEMGPLRTNEAEPLLPINPSELQARLSNEDQVSQQPAKDQESTQSVKDQVSQKSAEDYWIECIKKWYPELQSLTYFLPPLHFNKLVYLRKFVSGQRVNVPKNPMDCEVHGDRALELVLRSLRTLADDSEQTEVMMVISQLLFGKYVGEPCYAAAAALLLCSSKLSEEFLQHRYDKGDCDVLIIHRKLGLLTLEIKSVGGNFSQQEMTEQKQDDVVMKKVKKAVKQLNRAEVVLKHLTSDITNTTRISKILVLPNISSRQLKRAVNGTPDVQFLYQCLGVQNVDDAVKLCLLSDKLSDQHKSSDGNHNSRRKSQALREWWQHVVMASGPEQLMTSSLYEQLVARFCGPATTVEVHCVTAPRLNIRTLGEAVSETGERLARLVLFPQQVDILNRSLPGVFLSGPPGTGKTIVLIMQGFTWLQRGHEVHVVSTWDESRAVTIIIEHQLKETAKTLTARSHVYRHQFDFSKEGEEETVFIRQFKKYEVETAVRRLKSLSEGRQLCVIADEAVHNYYRKPFTKFCDQLIEQVPGVFIWGASVHHVVRPSCLEEVNLTTPLRSPPVVVREVMESMQIKNKHVHDYTDSDVPVPTDGPPVMRIKHRNGQSDHTGRWPLDCVECGHQIARVLTELDVGRTGDSNGPPPLQYRDVLVLCNDSPTDDPVKGSGLKTTTASGLVWGLRDHHVPLRVVEKGDEAAIHDMALGVGDLVTVANWDDVQGLERKVIFVETKIGGFHAMSRCTSQLVLLDC